MKIYDRIVAKKDIFYPGIKEPIALKGDKGVYHGQDDREKVVLFDRNAQTQTFTVYSNKDVDLVCDLKDFDNDIELDEKEKQ